MLYLARRHLGFTVEQWRAMPWWQTRLYEEGLVEEFAPRDGPDGPVEVVPPEARGIVWS